MAGSAAFTGSAGVADFAGSAGLAGSAGVTASAGVAGLVAPALAGSASGEDFDVVAFDSAALVPSTAVFCSVVAVFAAVVEVLLSAERIDVGALTLVAVVVAAGALRPAGSSDAGFWVNAVTTAIVLETYAPGRPTKRPKALASALIRF